MAGLLTLESNANPPLALKVNCEGTLCVFEAARILGLKKVVWSSSKTPIICVFQSIVNAAMCAMANAPH